MAITIGKKLTEHRFSNAHVPALVPDLILSAAGLEESMHSCFPPEGVQDLLEACR
jgi:hypothetical protein